MKNLCARCLNEVYFVANPSRIGVVTVTYNSTAVIPTFMDSVLSQSHSDFILYVVDNASTDETLKRVATYPDPRVVTIRNVDNIGVAEGNNVGIRAALGDGCDFILLLNNDTVFEAELFATLLRGLIARQCGMIVPKILYFDPSNKIWSAGGAFSLWRGMSWHFGFNQVDDGRFDEPIEVAYSPTCCMLISPYVFERIGLMDAKYFVYFDDTDFCLRAHREAMKLFYLPTARIYHKVSSLTGHRSNAAIRYLIRNHVYYVMKHFRSMLAYYLPICQINAVRKSLQAKNPWKAFLIAEMAFWEGLNLVPCSEEPEQKAVSSPRSPESSLQP
jgi:GT2 family glycosyltransferase